MTDQDNLTYLYRQNLEENIIRCLSETKSISLQEAMDIFYSSRLAVQIEQGTYGIDNLDYQCLTEDLIENEPELFAIPTM